MLRSFFLNKFELDYQANRSISVHLQLHEDGINPFINKQMSHVINMHHIWQCRLNGQPPESGEWDLLPSMYWDRLLEENHRNSQNYLLHFHEEAKVNFHDSEGIPIEKSDIDILYHILSHSQYHRAQIARELRLLELPVPSASFIKYR